MDCALCTRFGPLHPIACAHRFSGLDMPVRLTPPTLYSVGLSVKFGARCLGSSSRSRRAMLVRSAKAGLEQSVVDEKPVQEELISIIHEWEQLMPLILRLADFDLESKRKFADRMENVDEHMNAFITRLEGSNVPAEKAMLERLRSTWAGEGWSLELMAATTQVHLQRLRLSIDEEEKRGSKPVGVVAMEDNLSSSGERPEDDSSLVLLKEEK